MDRGGTDPFFRCRSTINRMGATLMDATNRIAALLRGVPYSITRAVVFEEVEPPPAGLLKHRDGTEEVIVVVPGSDR